MNFLIFSLAWISFGLALLSYFSGSIAILRGRAHPSVISRFFWLTLSITNFLSYAKMGAGTGLFLAVANTIGSAAIFFLSLRRGSLQLKRLDIITIIGASIALYCYLTVSIKLVALSAGLLTHFLSGIPTYKKIWDHPDSEDLLFWLLFSIASGCSLIAVILQNNSIIYPLYFLFFDAGITILLLIQRYRLKDSAVMLDSIS